LLAWTETRYGADARRRHEVLLQTGLREVALDPYLGGNIFRPELGQAVRGFHLRHSRDAARAIGAVVHAPRHLVIYRAIDPGIVDVGRILHDSMNLRRHVHEQD
jgi:toxin ParE1/3/4